MKRPLSLAIFCLTLTAFGCPSNVAKTDKGGDTGGKEAVDKGSSASVRLTGAGSTFVHPIMGKWIAEYEKGKSVTINYQAIGSGGGIQQMTSKTVDFGCTDAPMNQEQLDKAKKEGGEVVHIPLVMGAVVPIYNLP